MTYTKENNVVPWPVLKFDRYKDTLETVHLWTQIIGKVRLRQMPWLNHSWHVTLYVSPRGLTTGSMPYAGGIFEIVMDFTSHEVKVATSDGATRSMPLYPCSVADFYASFFDMLHNLGIDARIYGKPSEIAGAIPFSEDHVHCSYDKQEMNLLFQALMKTNVVFTRFRAGFRGKVSPVHFFWGAFDLAVTRFSGREAPKHSGGIPNMPDDVMQEAYSHEVSSCGFWPGGRDFPTPVFYSYCYPTPPDFGRQPVEPSEAFYSEQQGEFFLSYEVIRQSMDPEGTLMRFLKTTYRAAAITGHWDDSLECDLSHYKRLL
ncbi:DUF5996 family protein [Puia dinghuensis]|uniref:Ava_C0101 and related proteins n=1 Tax=Puia dinghuensis TaxID=1792502 RepID=A0A8J2XTU0_9BACT|nr:DUF5996 family protein [Puia dinghuensis]GGB02155.1 hypothetical protein GCM10011511_26770 [Puia dinghuensis]